MCSRSAPGSGFSTALLSHMVGNDGAVCSVDVDREMSERAARLLPMDGHSNVLLRTGDGRKGWAECAPFDRLVAWAAASVVPRAWHEQTREGAILVVPMRRKGQAWVSRYRHGQAGSMLEVHTVDGNSVAAVGNHGRARLGSVLGANSEGHFNRGRCLYVAVRIRRTQ